MLDDPFLSLYCSTYFMRNTHTHTHTHTHIYIYIYIYAHAHLLCEKVFHGNCEKVWRFIRKLEHLSDTCKPKAMKYVMTLKR
jgi:hypothetical protein